MASRIPASQIPFFDATSHSSQQYSQRPPQYASEGAVPRGHRAGEYAEYRQSNAETPPNFTAQPEQSTAASRGPVYSIPGQWGFFNTSFVPAATFPQIGFQNLPQAETWSWQHQRQQQWQQQYPHYGHVNPAFLPQQPMASTKHQANDPSGYRGSDAGYVSTYNARQWQRYGYKHRANQVSMADGQTQTSTKHQCNYQQNSQNYESAASRTQRPSIPDSYYENAINESYKTFRQDDRYDHRFSQLHSMVEPHMMSQQLTPPGENPRQYLLPRPKPSALYLERAKLPPRRLPEPKKLLVILDLNGTLLLRSGRGSKYTPRPRVQEFLTYCLENHLLIVWSSARPHNVKAMVAQLFTPEQHDQLVRVWSRDHLRLGKHFEAKVQVYKQLTWLWEDPVVQESFPLVPFKVEDGWKEPPPANWDQSNTVLLDDSVEKAASEPYNLIEVDELTRENLTDGDDVLGRVVAYLEDLKWEADVSAAMRERPFVNGRGGIWDWNKKERKPSA